MTSRTPGGPHRWAAAAVLCAFVLVGAGAVVIVGDSEVGAGPVRVTDAPLRISAVAETTTTSTSTTTSTTPPTTTTTPPPTTTTTAKPTPMALAGGSAPPVISRVTTTDPVVFFTIDDGMVQDPAALDFLRERKIPVTIFPNPGFVQQNPDYFQAIRELGGSVQDHTVSHPDLTRLGASAQQSEICGPVATYAGQFGQRPWLLRPPFGATNASVGAQAAACGIRAIVMWRATMNDGVLRTQGGPLQAGDIVLMHFRTDLRWNLEVALNAAAAAGLRPARLEDYLPSG